MTSSYPVADKPAQFLYGNSYCANQSMRDELNELLTYEEAYSRSPTSLMKNVDITGVSA